MKIITLGTLRVLADDRDVTDALPQKAKGLLAYVARAGRPEARELLAELLWEDQTPEKSSGSLRMSLSRLREVVGDALDISRSSVEYTGWLDANAFEAELRHLRPELNNAQPLTESSAARLDAALQLYGGDFLHGFYIPGSTTYDDWQSNQREALRHAFIDAASLLIDFRLVTHAYADGLALATRVLAVDPLREETHRQLMRLHATSGDRSSALKQYEACRALLDNELGVEPDDDTEALYEQILAGEVDIVPRAILVAAPAEAPRATPNNLPGRLTSFVGRADELSAIQALLASSRLVTLVGPGGIGKTQLSLEAATAQLPNFRDGVYFVDLAPVRDAEQVADFTHAALDLRDSSEKDTATTLEHVLRDREMLLLLDNFEHVLDAAQFVDRLLRVAPGLHMLTTSRQPLNLYGETVYAVPELPPDEAVTLFCERLQTARPGFVLDESSHAQVVAICARLEGLPLALELAARQAARMSLSDLQRGLEKRLSMLRSTARNLPPRQQTLFGAMDWSYALLTEAEQAVYRRLSVFVGGWTAEAAEAICGGDAFALDELVDKSLVRLRLEPTPRYTLLEMIREHAADKLAQHGETGATTQAHADYFLRQAQTAARTWRKVGEAEWFERLDADHDNLRAALRYFDTTPGREADHARLVGALGWFWYRRSNNREAIVQTWKVVARFDEPELTADAVAGGGHAAHELGDMDLANAWHTAALVAYQQLGDKPNQAFMYFCLSAHTKNPHDGIALNEQALRLARELGDITQQIFCLYGLGNSQALMGHCQQACANLTEALTLCRAQHLDYEGDIMMSLAHAYMTLGDMQTAFDVSYEACQIGAQNHRLAVQINSMTIMGTSRILLGRLDDAEQWLRDALELATRNGYGSERIGAAANLALVASSRDDDAEMVRLYREAVQPEIEFIDIDVFELFVFVAHIAGVLATRGQPATAVEIVHLFEATFQANGFVAGALHRHYIDIARTTIEHQLGAGILNAAPDAPHKRDPQEIFAYAVSLLDRLDTRETVK